MLIQITDMTPASNNRLLTTTVILLLIANVATLALFWIGNKNKGRQKPPMPSEYLIRELSFDNKQQQAYMEMVKNHRAAAAALREKLKEAKDNYFELLAKENAGDSLKESSLNNIAAISKQLDQLTFSHFAEVRKLCTPVQQVKFEHTIKNVLRMMSGPPPPGPRGEPPPGGPPEN